MRPEISLRLQSTTAAAAAGEDGRPMVSIVLVQAGSLLQTYGVVWVMCRTPWSNSLSWPGMLRTAAISLTVTMLAHAVAVWANCRMFQRHVDGATSTLMVATWPAVAWVPVLVLLRREESAWMVAVPGLIVCSAVLSVWMWTSAAGDRGPSDARDGAGRDDTGPGDAGPISSLFRPVERRSLLRVAGPPVFASVALQAAVAALATGRRAGAGYLLAAGVLVPAWRVVQLRRGERAGWTVRRLARRTLSVFVLLAIGLMPYLRSRGVAEAMGGVLRVTRAGASRDGAAAKRGRDTTYTGVILVLPRKRPREILLPAAAARTEFGGVRRPVLIVFDGAYWYFKRPDERPRADAPVVQGDPRKKSIRSTDRRPLLMEAHQRLSRAIRMDCCSGMRVAIQNADTTRGAIQVEVLLRDGLGKAAAQSLGVQVLRSSEGRESARARSPVEEVLTYAFPRRVGGQRLGKRFDEITVRILPEGERALAGARVAVESFELLP